MGTDGNFQELEKQQEALFYAVTAFTVIPSCLISLCCCCFFCKNWCEYAYDDDDDGPAQKKLSDLDHAKLGKKKRMGLGQSAVWILRSAWDLLGDACQALIFLGMGCWFFMIALLNCFPGTFTTPIWALYILILILGAVIAGTFGKLGWAVYEQHLSERMHKTHDVMHKRMDEIQHSLEPIRRMEEPLMRFVESVESKVATIEEALAGQLKKAKKQFEKAEHMAKDGLKVVSSFAEEELEKAEELEKKYCPACGCRSL